MRTHRSRSRYEPTVVYMLAEQARAEGVDLSSATGPWRADRRWRVYADLPVVTNDRTEVVVDTMEHATEVAGLLNSCGVLDLAPVPELVPWDDTVRLEMAGA